MAKLCLGLLNEMTPMVTASCMDFLVFLSTLTRRKGRNSDEDLKIELPFISISSSRSRPFVKLEITALQYVELRC